MGVNYEKRLQRVRSFVPLSLWHCFHTLNVGPLARKGEQKTV